MRTNIDINDELLAKAMQAGPYRTKKEAVEAGLKVLVRRAAYQAIRALRGKVVWDDSDSTTPAWETGSAERVTPKTRKNQASKPHATKRRSAPVRAVRKKASA